MGKKMNNLRPRITHFGKTPKGAGYFLKIPPANVTKAHIKAAEEQVWKALDEAEKYVRKLKGPRAKAEAKIADQNVWYALDYMESLKTRYHDKKFTEEAEHWTNHINDPLVGLNPREKYVTVRLNIAADKKESKYHLQGKQSSMHLTLDMDGKDVLERTYDDDSRIRVTRSLKTGRLSYKYIPDHKRVRNKEAERFADKIVETY
tara:strand:+ start:225 stop:836 length:612 start_codon:yes stop_codon:yes gene_type:complete